MGAIIAGTLRGQKRHRGGHSRRRRSPGRIGSGEITGLAGRCPRRSCSPVRKSPIQVLASGPDLKYNGIDVFPRPRAAPMAPEPAGPCSPVMATTGRQGPQVVPTRSVLARKTFPARPDRSVTVFNAPVYCWQKREVGLLGPPPEQWEP
jgi:hypothetical protein